MKLAVISDVHGNMQGLEAVLGDIRRRGVDIIWCGGDLVGYGANPNEVIDLVRRLGIPTVMGNYDESIGYDRPTCGCDYADPAAHERGIQSVMWTRAHTTPENKAFLRSLPHCLQRDFAGHKVALVHGSPVQLNEYLFETIADDVFRAHLATTGADILIFGHTHKPYHKVLDGKHLVCCGSSGKPKHGNPHATYVQFTLDYEHLAVDIIEVPYDHEAAARAVETAGLPAAFAQQLRAGRS